MKKENCNVVVVSCPPCGENVGLPTKRGFLNKESYLATPHRPYGALSPQVGKSTAPGFTLIELLVVVLIIGILAAVALPQYKKAVIKSRATEAMTMLKVIGEAQEVYYLAHGHYTTDLTELDIDVPADKIEPVDEDGKEIMQEHYAYRCWNLGCGAESSQADWPSFELNLIHTGLIRRGKLSCRVHPSENKSELATSICLAMSSLPRQSDGYYTIN